MFGKTFSNADLNIVRDLHLHAVKCFAHAAEICNESKFLRVHQDCIRDAGVICYTGGLRIYQDFSRMRSRFVVSARPW